MISIHPATPEEWDDVRTVFGTRGDSSWCFCQYFTDPEWNRGKEPNKNSLRQQIEALDPPPGLLAYKEGEPVGWIQTGPSSRYARFNPRGHLAEDDIWVITCFVVRGEYRGTGIATALLHEAVKHARKHGANTLRARPTDTTLIRKSSAALFTGILSTFDAAGFNHVNQNRSRVLVELNLNQHSQTLTDS